jgi:REP element-mobilizing transposase RayT
MSRLPRELKHNFCYHVTTRCNNREFHLIRDEYREVLLYALQRCRERYGFKLYGLCIMSNHVHYLVQPTQPEDLPKIMHWLNWFTAMCFNRMMNRTGHFWEKRYHSTGFAIADQRRALNTLRYIHANPKAANMQQGFFYDFSNYGIYDRLSEDGQRVASGVFGVGEDAGFVCRGVSQVLQEIQAQPQAREAKPLGEQTAGTDQGTEQGEEENAGTKVAVGGVGNPSGGNSPGGEEVCVGKLLRPTGSGREI